MRILLIQPAPKSSELTIDDIGRGKPMLDITGNPEFYIRSDTVLGEHIIDNRKGKEA